MTGSTAATVTDGPLQVISLDVEGMTCASCVNRIERFVNKVEGVSTGSVNLATERASISFDPAITNVEELACTGRGVYTDIRRAPMNQTGTKRRRHR